MRVSINLEYDDFSASIGWLEAWQKRFRVRLATLCGDAAEVPKHVVVDRAQRLPVITEGYQLADIYNSDETGLYFRALPNRSMVVRDNPRKTSKDRITVLLACSADGDKFKPLVIAKSENPRCFRGITKAAFPVIYRANKTARMTTIMFKEWLERLNGQMTLQSRNILLVVDNCGAHPAVHLSNVEI